MDNYPAPPARMRVIDSLVEATGHARRMLFEPFRFEVWISIGVIAFLEALGNPSSGGSGSYGGGGGNQNVPTGQDFSEAVRHGVQYIQDNLGTILLIGGAILIAILAISILLVWLGSRGTLMLVRAVATTDARIGENWRATARAAQSLFLFRLALMGIGFLISLGVLTFAAVSVISLARQDTDAWQPYFVALLPMLVAMLILGLTFWLISTLLRNFVAPLMYRFDAGAIEGWRCFREVSRGNILAIIGFLFIRFAYFLAFAVTTVVVGCVTCCLGFLPVIHHTIFAPFYVFDRAFSLFMLGSAGPDYAIVQPAPPPVQPQLYEPAPLLDRFPNRPPEPPEEPPRREDPPKRDPFRDPFG